MDKFAKLSIINDSTRKLVQLRKNKVLEGKKAVSLRRYISKVKVKQASKEANKIKLKFLENKFRSRHIKSIRSYSRIYFKNRNFEFDAKNSTLCLISKRQKNINLT